MNKKIIFVLAFLGVFTGLLTAYVLSQHDKPQPPLFSPISSPFENAIYANGIVESVQGGGSNINIYPDVSGTITHVYVQEGQKVASGTVLLTIDDTLQQATVGQIKLQAQAAEATFNELKAQPRKEVLSVAQAQVELARANLMIARNQYDKRRAAFNLNPKAISKDILDSSQDAVSQAQAALDLARKQLDLTQAGAWSYDILNQQKQFESLEKSLQASQALLAKYTIKAQSDGIVLAVNAAPGSYVSPLGIFNSYTQMATPIVVMGALQEVLAVRCYVDEILVSRLPPPDQMQAMLMIRGTDIKIPLEFDRIQPYVSPKIALSDQRQERVDLRVLPIIFKFKMEKIANIYPGQLVDVFIGQKNVQRHH